LTSTSLAQIHPHVNDFIPPGWEIEYSLKSDLTGDGVQDVAMILVQRVDDSTYGNRKLIVLKNRDTDHDLIGRNDSALWSADPEEVGSITKGDSVAMNLHSKHGTLILNESAHFGIHTNMSQITFRYDAAHNRMREIGADCDNYERDGFGEDDISKNFLTGTMIEVKSVLDKNDKETDGLTKSRKRIPKKVIWMEQAVEAR